jgi:hypothetical protein
MNDMGMFCLGVAVAIIIIFIIVTVAVMVRLNKKVKSTESLILGLQQDAENDRRNCSLQDNGTSRQLCDEVSRLERVIAESFNDALKDAGRYTDSRVDKALGIQKGGLEGKAGIE